MRNIGLIRTSPSFDEENIDKDVLEQHKKIEVFAKIHKLKLHQIIYEIGVPAYGEDNLEMIKRVKKTIKCNCRLIMVNLCIISREIETILSFRAYCANKNNRIISIKERAPEDRNERIEVLLKILYESIKKLILTNEIRIHSINKNKEHMCNIGGKLPYGKKRHPKDTKRLIIDRKENKIKLLFLKLLKENYSVKEIQKYCKEKNIRNRRNRIFTKVRLFNEMFKNFFKLLE